MDNAAFVRSLQRFGDLTRDAQYIARLRTPAREKFVESLPGHELEDEIAEVTAGLEPMNGGNVAVVERGQQARLPFKPRTPLDIVRAVFRKYLIATERPSVISTAR